MSYIERRGKRVFFEQFGIGDPALVFVHGFSCSHEDWKYQVGYFKNKFNVTTCDLNGHGFSEPDPVNSNIETLGTDINALISKVYANEIVLAGHSLGCRVVLEAYKHIPGKVKGIVLIEGSRGSPPGDRREAELLIIEKIRNAGYRDFLGNFFEAMFFGGYDPGLKEHIIRRALLLPEEIGIPLFASTVGWDACELDSALSKINVPLLVVQSTYMTPGRERVQLKPGQTSQWIELIKKYLPEARIEIVSDAGHFVMLERPDLVNHHIEVFLVEISG